MCSKCGAEHGREGVKQLLDEVAKDMEELDRNSMKAIRQLISKYSGKLHKNNGVVVELKQILIAGFGRLPGHTMNDLKESDHKEKIVLCHDVLTVLNKVEPGLALGRGLMLFELHSSLVMVSWVLLLRHLLSRCLTWSLRERTTRVNCSVV